MSNPRLYGLIFYDDENKWYEPNEGYFIDNVNEYIKEYRKSELKGIYKGLCSALEYINYDID